MTNTAISIPMYRVFVTGLTALALVSLVSYIGFTAATIFATADRTAASREGKALTSAIGELERSYFSLEHRITPEEAASRGFVAPVHISYATLERNTLSLNTEEPR